LLHIIYNQLSLPKIQLQLRLS